MPHNYHLKGAMHMISTRVITTIAVAVAAIMVSTGTAYAEFSSSSSQGKGQNVELKLEAGGGTVLCGEHNEEGEASTSWKIEKGTEASTKGPKLLVHVEKWGRCWVKVGKEETEASSTACELEVTQAKEENPVKASVLTACKFTVKTCEIKLEPTENKELKEVKLETNGEKGENLQLNFSLTSVTTIASKCEAMGIKSSKEGTLAAADQVQNAAAQNLPVQFFVGARKRVFTTVGEKVEVAITNGTMSLLTPTIAVREDPVRNPVTFTPENLAGCQMSYAPGEFCTFKVMYNGPYPPLTFYYITATGPNTVSNEISLF